MIYFLTRRTLHGFMVILIISVIVFIALHLAPGDPAQMMAPNFGGTLSDKQLLNNIREQMGLNRPLYIQYLDFLAKMLQGNFGTSLHAHIPVGRMIKQRLPATIELTFLSMIWAILFAIPLGIASARRQGSGVDWFSRILALIGVSTPSFWLGIMLILLFSLHMAWFPTGGRGGWTSYILPTLNLGIQQVAVIARLTRSSMLEHLDKDYVRTARSKGLTEFKTVYKHTLKNGLIPVITIVGLQFGTLLGGAVITETVFSWPGIGSMLLEAILTRDFPVVQAIVFIFAALFVALNIIVDICYAMLDPRIRYS